MSGQFFTDEEKLKYYAGISKIDLNVYSILRTLKVYEGAEILLYHWQGQEALFDTVIVCTNITATDRGLRISFIDRKRLRLFTVGDVPNLIWPYDIVSHVPYSCEMERTVKVTGKGKTIQDLTVQICFRISDESVDAISLSEAKRFFEPAVYARAINRLEENYG